MGSTGRMNNRLESVFEYNVPYDDTTLSLSTHDTEIRRTNGSQIPGNSRGQPMSYQSCIEVHASYSKNVVQEREDQRHLMAAKYQKYVDGKKNYIRQLQGLHLNVDDDDDKPFGDVIAPLHTEKVFYCKTGNILFIAIPWGIRFPAEKKMPGASNVYVSDCFNGLSKFVRLIFHGFAAGESCAWANDGRDDFATHVFGTGTFAPNYGPITLPIGVSTYMSGMGYTTMTSVGKVPVFAPHGQDKHKVMPFPFYLKDTNVYSIQQRVRFFVTDRINLREKESPNDPEQVYEAVFSDIMGFITESHLTPEIRTEIMIDDMVRLMGIHHLLRRATVWFASNNQLIADEVENERRILLKVCQMAYRVAQAFLLKQEQVATYYMSCVLQKDVRIEHEMLTLNWAEVFPDNMLRGDLLKRKFWLETTVESYIDVTRSCFTAILKDRWMGTTCNKTSGPNSSYDMLIRIGHPDVC